MAKLMYFAQLAETLGRTSEEAALPATVVNVQGLIEWLSRREGPGWKSLASGKGLTIMVNRKPATGETALSANDEVAFIPERQ